MGCMVSLICTVYHMILCLYNNMKFDYMLYVDIWLKTFYNLCTRAFLYYRVQPFMHMLQFLKEELPHHCHSSTVSSEFHKN